jgi:hypothetical protein
MTPAAASCEGVRRSKTGAPFRPDTRMAAGSLCIWYGLAR